MKLAWPVLFSITLLSFSQDLARADTVFLDFESLANGDIVTNQFPKLTFQNAIILTAGVSVNEFEFPPHSGTNVVSDNGGPISIAFDSPTVAFSGYFTYGESLTLTAFDASSLPVASISSAFSSNDALFGDLGSSSNEFLQVQFARGISSVTIAGDPLGGSFVMDDITLASAVPEPNTRLVSFGVLMLIFVRRASNKFSS